MYTRNFTDCIVSAKENVLMSPGPYTLMGMLGKPKLAVQQLGTLKKVIKVISTAMSRVIRTGFGKIAEQYHQIIDFFWQVTKNWCLAQLNKKMAEFQEILIESDAWRQQVLMTLKHWQ